MAEAISDREGPCRKVDRFDCSDDDRCRAELAAKRDYGVARLDGPRCRLGEERREKEVILKSDEQDAAKRVVVESPLERPCCVEPSETAADDDDVEMGVCCRVLDNRRRLGSHVRSVGLLGRGRAIARLGAARVRF